MIDAVKNLSTKASPISEGYARKVWLEFCKIYGADPDANHEFDERQARLLIKFAAWMFRGDGSVDEEKQVVKGWSKLRITPKDLPSEEFAELVKSMPEGNADG